MTFTREQWDAMSRHVEAAKSGGARVLSNMSLVAKELDALQPTEPTSTSTMRLGLTPGPAPDSEPDWRKQNMPYLEGLFGLQGIRRTFQQSVPASIDKSYAGPDVGKRASWVSMKGSWGAVAAGGSDAALRAYLVSIPADHELMLTFNHEPENDGGDPKVFRAAAEHFNQVVKDERPQTSVGPILMDWTFDPASGRTPNDWIPGGTYDFIGIDTYQTYLFPPSGSPTVWKTAPTVRQKNALAYIKTLGAAPAIGEFACGSWNGSTGTDPANYVRKIAWIDTTLKLFEDAGGVAACYFDTGINNDIAPDSLLEADGATIEYWSGVTASHPAGKV